jgi:metal-responsive CopG/Arc/MetJ family transcriptional regulator
MPINKIDMKKQSKIFKGLHSALDELEVFVLEGEILDLDLVEGLMKRFKKLHKSIKKLKNKGSSEQSSEEPL